MCVIYEKWQKHLNLTNCNEFFVLIIYDPMKISTHTTQESRIFTELLFRFIRSTELYQKSPESFVGRDKNCVGTCDKNRK